MKINVRPLVSLHFLDLPIHVIATSNMELFKFKLAKIK